MKREKLRGKLDERTKKIWGRDVEELYSINFKTDLLPVKGIIVHADRCAPIFSNPNIGKRIEMLTSFNALTLCAYNSALIYTTGYGLKYLIESYFK